MIRRTTVRLVMAFGVTALGAAAPSAGAGAPAQPAAPEPRSGSAATAQIPMPTPLPATAPAPSSAPLPSPLPGAAPAVPMPAATPDRAGRDALPSALPPALATGGAGAVGAPAAPAQMRQVTYSLRQLGALGPLNLRGASELQGLQFGVREDEVVTDARLKLNGAMSPALLPQFSNVTVTLNEQYFGTILVKDGAPRFDNLEMTINPAFFAGDNRLNFRFTGRYTEQCNDPLSGLLWSTVSDTSTLTLTLVRLPATRDLAKLPAPFFDSRERQFLSLPFIIEANPDDNALQSAGMVASWFGQLADFRGAGFPVSPAAPATGNAVVIATADKIPAGLNAPAINGPTVAVLPNPNDPRGSLLLVSGRTGAEVVSAAQSLTLGSRALAGEVAAVAAPAVAPRAPYDAPAWIPTDRPVKFGELVDVASLQASGYAPGAIRVPFRTAPDLYTWRNRGLPLDLRYRAPLGPVLDIAVSRLDVGLNNLYVAGLPLGESPIGPGSWLPEAVRREADRHELNAGDESLAKLVKLPIFGVFGQNEMQFSFDTRPLHRGDCIAVPSDPRMSIDPDSTIDLRGAGRMATLPNLAFFINSGFPFSRMADLSETAVVLAQQPSDAEIQTYLELLGRIGAFTGLPAVRVAVARPDEVNKFGDRDLLMIGSLQHLRGAANLLANSPFRIGDRDVELQFSSPLATIRRFIGADGAASSAQTAIQTATAGRFAAIIGAESPLQRGRSVVAVLASDPKAIEGVAPLTRNDEQAAKIQGDLAIVTGGNVTSFRVGPTYSVGHLSPWLYLSWIIGDSPVGFALALLAGAGLLAAFGVRTLKRRARDRTAKTAA